MEGLQLIATGGALPGRLVTNEDLSRVVDTSDEWIVSRTGIRQRHFCTADQNAATLAIDAARQAVARSGLSPAVTTLGLPDGFVTQGSPKELLASCGLDAAGIAASV